MKKFKIAYLLIFLFVLIGCGQRRNLEIFRFVNHEHQIQVGETINLQLIMGEYKDDAVVTYSFSEEGIIKFEDGFATGLKVGEVVVSATVDKVKYAYTRVIVTREPVDGLQIIAEKNTIYVDEELPLDVKIFPEHFSNEVTWTIELGTDVAVIEDGILKPLRGENGLQEFNNGGARVRVVATSVEDDRVSAKRDFFVKYRPTSELTLTADVVEVALEDIENEVITKITLEVGILPDAANPLLTFTSSDETIALVDVEGIVTFPETPKAGTVTITVTSIDGVEATIEITITEPEPEEEESEEEEETGGEESEDKEEN